MEPIINNVTNAACNKGDTVFDDIDLGNMPDKLNNLEVTDVTPRVFVQALL